MEKECISQNCQYAESLSKLCIEANKVGVKAYQRTIIALSVFSVINLFAIGVLIWLLSHQ
jgi:hypothetical protein